MTGYYVFSENGKELCRSNNIITNIGRRHILDYLANKIQDRSRYIGVGIGNVTAAAADYKLNFEINKYRVYYTTVDYANSTIIMKAELPLQLAATISEVALFPGFSNSRDFDSRVLTLFNNDVTWSNGSYIENSPNSKINNTSFKIDANDTTTVATSSNLIFDFSGYSVNDSLSFAFYQSDINLDYIDFKMYSSDTSYYTHRIEGTTSVGHRIVEVPLATLLSNPTNNPRSSIIKFQMVVKANTSTSTTVEFDGIRISDNDTYVQEGGAISRAVLGQPITKEFGRILDVEYRMVLL